MQSTIELALRAALVGLGATALLDLSLAALHRVGGPTPPDYSMVGRWFGHMTRGRVRHARISASPSVPHERLLGWAVHYATGIAFAFALLAVSGPDWARGPTLFPALAFGLATVLFPFLVMQPAMGNGVAASRAPDPAAARRRSLLTHLLFGLGLYATSAVLVRLMPGA